ncbi:UbiA family prenyltransferase [Panacibacter microcysteis]|uniref:UbiA family prenyltransferase n=1 Tax=Panacibacter microcysteis TaxID=2793269 RepID=UPI001E5D8F3A|nr:UbiA family prenyltransferase [Panacibacter microcysteis]
MQSSTVQLLRFPFSFFLLPVFFFALSFVGSIHWLHAIAALLIIHLLIYPSSNGYNSYMDRDTDSIGGLEKPEQPTKELFYVTIAMDIAALLLAYFVNPLFAFGLVVYILFSRLYSYRGIRLKKYPVIGYVTVVLNQGALIFALVFYTADKTGVQDIPLIPLAASIFLIGGFYPITQVYQHAADKKDNVRTISMLLGKRGTFVFCGIMYAIAFALLFIQYNSTGSIRMFIILQLFFIPVVFYFIKWFVAVFKDEKAASFKNTMRMNMLAATCTNLAFITIIILHQIG